MGLIVALLPIGCTTRVALHPRPPAILTAKLPGRLLLVVPPELRARECTYSEVIARYVFDCGASFSRVASETLARLFEDLAASDTIAAAQTGWLRAIVLEVSELRFVRPGWTEGAGVAITLRYRVLDRQQEERFRSVIAIEERVGQSRVNAPAALPAAFAGNASGREASGTQVAQVMVPVPSAESWAPPLFQRLFERVLLQLSLELVDAHESGVL